MGTIRIKWPWRGVSADLHVQIHSDSIHFTEGKGQNQEAKTSSIKRNCYFHRLAGLRKRHCANVVSSTNIWHLLSAPYVASVLSERASILVTSMLYLLSYALPSINIHCFCNVMFSIQKPLEFAKWKLIKERKGTQLLAYRVHFTSSSIQMQTSGWDTSDISLSQQTRSSIYKLTKMTKIFSFSPWKAGTIAYKTYGLHSFTLLVWRII